MSDYKCICQHLIDEHNLNMEETMRGDVAIFDGCGLCDCSDVIIE